MQKQLNYQFLLKLIFLCIVKVPILVYGSPLTGIVNYALKYNWAYVLTERSHEKLTKCLIDLHYDYDLRQKLIDKAYMVALENHNLSKIEKDF